MFEQFSFGPRVDTCRGSVAGKDPESGWHRPTQNRIIAALPAADYERLLSDLEPVSLPLGWTVHDADDQQKYVYFVTAGIVCRVCVTDNGASAAFAVTGSEGVIGVASFLGDGSTPSQAKVASAGHAFCLRASLLKNEFEHDGMLPRLLLRYTLALFTQIGQVAACNRHHSLEQRLCRLLLSCLDRMPSNDLRMTHKRVADMLGVRREGVTEAAGMLQEAGLIHCRRAEIAVLDRSRLEARACECYAVIRREYNRLLAAQRCSGVTGRHIRARRQGRVELSLRSRKQC